MSRVYEVHKLRRKVRCANLSPEGNQCSDRAIWEGAYLGDPEGADTWILTQLCDTHARAERWLK